MPQYEIRETQSSAFEIDGGEEIVAADIASQPNAEHRFLVRLEETSEGVGRCMYPTDDGSRCQRDAEPGERCWQHND